MKTFYGINVYANETEGSYASSLSFHTEALSLPLKNIFFCLLYTVEYIHSVTVLSRRSILLVYSVLCTCSTFINCAAFFSCLLFVLGWLAPVSRSTSLVSDHKHWSVITNQGAYFLHCMDLHWLAKIPCFLWQLTVCAISVHSVEPSKVQTTGIQWLMGYYSLLKHKRKDLSTIRDMRTGLQPSRKDRVLLIFIYWSVEIVLSMISMFLFPVGL